MKTEPLIQPFPMPDSDLIRDAYWNLYLSEEGTEQQKEYLGDASLLPRPWDIATCTRPDLRCDIWQWYEDVVTWFNHEYVWDPAAGFIPPCWPLHPHLVHEIGTLADQRRRVALAINSNAMEEWHRYSVPNFFDRLRERVKQHCDDNHQAWPARTRYARHVSEGESATRSRAAAADAAGVTSATSTPLVPILYLVDGETGSRIDPGTGELL